MDGGPGMTPTHQYERTIAHLLRYWPQRQLVQAGYCLDPIQVDRAGYGLIDHTERATWRQLAEHLRDQMLISQRTDWYLMHPAAPDEIDDPHRTHLLLVPRDQLLQAAQTVLQTNGPGPGGVQIALRIRAMTVPVLDLFAD